MNNPNKKEGRSAGKLFAAAQGFFKNKKKLHEHHDTRIVDEHAEHLGVGASHFTPRNHEHHSHEGVSE